MTTFNQNTGDDNSNQNQSENQSQGTSFNAPAGEQTNTPPNGGEGEFKISKEEYQKLLKRLDDSQSFIDTLKTETRTYREQIEELQGKTGPSIDEIMEKLKDQQGGSTNIDPDEIVQRATQVMEQNLTAKQKAEKEDKNFNEVASVLSKQFGREVDDKVTQLAQENGMSYDDIVDMAKRSPKAALKLLGVKAEPERGSPAPSRGSVNTLGMPQQTQQPRTTNLAKLTTDKDRVAYLQQEMAERLKKYQQ